MLDFIRTTHAKLFQWYKHLLSLKVVPNVSNESLTSKVLK